MGKTQVWFAWQKKRKENIVSLYHAAFAHNILPYVYYRLRYFGFNSIILSFCYAIECYFLYFYIGFTNAISIVGLRFLVVAINNSWWCVSEILRTRVRYYYQKRMRQAVNDEISMWITGSLCIAVIVAIILGSVFIHVSYYLVSSRKLIFEIYAAILLFHVGSAILVSTIHSSLYALRRISRPFLSVSIAQLLGLFSMVITYHWLRLYTLAGAYFLETILNIGISLYYIQRMNRLMNILPKKLIVFSKIGKFFIGFLNKEALILILTGVALSSQLLLLYFILYYSNMMYRFHLIIVMFLISPQFHQLYNWAVLFYFDFKRLSKIEMQNVYQQLDRALKYPAFFVALAMWLLSVCFIKLFFEEGWRAMSLALLPIYLARSFYGYKCIEYFCTFRYWDIITSAVVSCLIISIILAISAKHFVSYLVCIFAAFLLALVVMLISHFPRVKPQEAKHVGVMPFLRLLTMTVSVEQEVELKLLQLINRINSSQRNALIEELCKFGKVALLNEQLLLFISNNVTDLRYFDKTAGLLHCNFTTGKQASGKLAVQKFYDYLNNSLLQDNDEDLKIIKQNCISIDLKESVTSGEISLSADEYAKINGGVMRFIYSPWVKISRSENYVIATETEQVIDKIQVIKFDKISYSQYIKWRNATLKSEFNKLLGINYG
jgi:hypothetical protein